MTADELRTIIKNLPPIEDADIWANHRRSLRKHILESDPKSFLKWSTVQATMYVNAPFIPTEYKTLPDRLREVAKGRSFGGAAYRGHDTNLIHQAYHLSQWERVTGQRVESLNRIIEFGGGYGAMCLICRRLGFQGKYVIIDLPELGLLQRYYLSNVLKVDDFSYKAPNYLLDDPDRYYLINCDLFIASHSLSEANLELRKLVLSRVNPFSLLFVFHCEHNGVDNLEWFRQLAKDKPEYEWQQWYTEHLPNQWYQVGVRK